MASISDPLLWRQHAIDYRGYERAARRSECVSRRLPAPACVQYAVGQPAERRRHPAVGRNHRVRRVRDVEADDDPRRTRGRNRHRSARVPVWTARAVLSRPRRADSESRHRHPVRCAAVNGGDDAEIVAAGFCAATAARNPRPRPTRARRSREERRVFRPASLVR